MIAISGVRDNAEVIFYDHLGHMVYSADDMGSSQRVNTTNLSSGIYTVVFRFTDKQLVRRLIIME